MAFLDTATAPLGVHFHKPECAVGERKLRPLLFVYCLTCGRELKYLCRDGCGKGRFGIFTEIAFATEDGAFYCDRNDGCIRDGEDDYESVAEFYSEVPDIVKSQLYVRKLLAQSLRPLTAEMCHENIDAAILINELLNLPKAIYNKSEMQTFRTTVAKLQKIIDAYFAPGGVVAEQLAADWEEKSTKNDNDDNDGTATTAETKKRKK